MKNLGSGIEMVLKICKGRAALQQPPYVGRRRRNGTGKDGVRINFCDSKQGGNASHSPCHSDQQTGILFSTETMTLR